MKRINHEIFYELHDFYRRRTLSGGIESLEEAEHVYACYLTYVQATVHGASPQPSVLDVGCGVGWSSVLMAQAGFAERIVATDLGVTFVDRTVNSKLSFVSADALSLPFVTASFDIVTGYQFLEHVPEPGRALDEMMRVLKPGGIIIVAGPNLLSPLVALRDLARFLLTRPPILWFTQNPGELRGPFGSTLPGRVGVVFSNFTLLIKKTWSPTVEFVLRTPDLREPAHGDTDACYLLNPVDVRKYLSQRGLRILRYQDGGRLKLGKLGVLKGGTWVVARKPNEVGKMNMMESLEAQAPSVRTADSR